MSDSPNLIRGGVHGRWGKQFWGILPGAWLLRGSRKTVDPLYIWSAAVAVFAALVLIAVALVIQAGRVH